MCCENTAYFTAGMKRMGLQVRTLRSEGRIFSVYVIYLHLSPGHCPTSSVSLLLYNLNFLLYNCLNYKSEDLRSEVCFLHGDGAAADTDV